MPVARHLAVVLFATVWLISGCVSVAPGTSTRPVVTPAGDTGGQATAEPIPSQPSIVEPSLAPDPLATTPPTEPTEPPTEPTEPPTETQTREPDPVVRPDVRVLKVVVVRAPVVVGEAAELRASVVNYADTAAREFDVQFAIAQPDQDEVIVGTQTVAGGLKAGASTDLIVSVTPIAAGPLKLIARVDPTDQLTESDETNNETTLDINVEQSAGNLSFGADGLNVFSGGDPAGAPGVYFFVIKLTNTGLSTMTGPLSVKYFGYTDADEYVEWATEVYDMDLAPGDSLNQQTGWAVDPGTYRAIALADPDNVWPETDKDDNEASFDFTAP